MSYEVRFSPAATRQFRKLPAEQQRPIRKALSRLASRAGKRGSERGGKTLKKIQGRDDSFFRMRTGDYCVIYDQIDSEKTIPVLGVVNRRDLERWLRGR